MPAERDPALPSMAAGGGRQGRGSGRAWTAAALAALGVVGLLALLLSGDGDNEAPAGALSSLLALTAVPAIAVLAAFAAHHWTARRYAAALREARMTLHLQPQLLDQWQWRTDAGHRVLAWTPAVGAPAVHWSATGHTGQPLWDGFEAEDGQDALRQRLQAHQPLIDVEVRQRGGPGAVSTWRLRGAPRYDVEGRFAGYLGTARPIDVERAQQGDHAALLLLLKAWPGPVWLLEQPHAGARWTLVQSNDAAAQLLPRRPTPAATDLEALMAALPDGLGPALSPLVATGGSATVGDWEARLEHSADRGDGAPALLLLGLLPRAAAAAAAEPAEQASFIYTISHDLRAPIRVVEGFTRILKEDYGRLLDRIGNDHFDRVLGAAARMNTMIDAMLSLSALSTQPLQRQPVNLSQLARFIVDDLRRQSPQRTVQVDIADGLAATGDPTLLRLVLENLLGNAWKYSTKREAAHIAFEATEHDGRAAFVVRDNGAGFDMRFADRLFGVFQRLHSANDFAGTGVGLASVRRIVRRHGGDVWAESEVGQGARFYFTLAGSSAGMLSRPTPLVENHTYTER